jgi:hypothetical protein
MKEDRLKAIFGGITAMRYSVCLLMVVVFGVSGFCQDDKNKNVDPLHGEPITYYVPEGLEPLTK